MAEKSKRALSLSPEETRKKSKDVNGEANITNAKKHSQKSKDTQPAENKSKIYPPNNPEDITVTNEHKAILNSVQNLTDVDKVFKEMFELAGKESEQ